MVLVVSSFLPSFLASIVEFVEALTVVLAIGVSINWKSSLWGAGAASVVLAVLIGAFGTSLVVLVPLEVLRVVVGLLLVLFGLQWLRKALLRAAGVKALHDEAEIYQRQLGAAQAQAGDRRVFSPFGFITSFKSVLLEGLEVAFIVITFGATVGQHRGLGSAILGAAAAFVLVLVVGFVVRKPLTRVPENALKFFVGLMLVSFGVFWAGEGLGVEWPGADWFLLALIATGLVFSAVATRWLKGRTARPSGPEAPKPRLLVRWALEVFDFLCGDWWVFGGLTVTVVVVWALGQGDALAGARVAAGWVWVLGTVASLGWSLNRQTAPKPKG